MKTNPITLIVSLLFCLIGGVFAEGDKKAKENRANLAKAVTAFQKAHKTQRELNGSISQLAIAGEANENIKLDYDISMQFRIFTDAIYQMNKITIIIDEYDLDYKKIKVDKEGTVNELLLRHNTRKQKHIAKTMDAIKETLKIAKKLRVLLTGTAIVLNMNEMIKVMNDLDKAYNGYSLNAIFYDTKSKSMKINVLDKE
jgi:hypothetical protein